MIKLFLKKQFMKNRAVIIKEGKYLQNFMLLLMKQKNTGVKWTGEEKTQIKSDLKHLSLYVPVLIIFVLPFGSLLLPILTEVLDRRDKDRVKYKALFLVALAFYVFAGCEYESPLTNVHNISVDSAVLGLWETVPDNNETAGSNEKMLILKYSDTEYLVHYPIGDEAFYFRGYPIKIGNISCVQVQLIGDTNGDIKKEERKYQVVSYELSNGELEIKTLNTDLVDKNLKNSKKLRKAFMKNRGNEELFQNPVKFAKCVKK